MIIKADKLIIGDSKTILDDYGVKIDTVTGKIAKLAPISRLCKEFPDEPVQEYAEVTLLPGLIDMHVHLGNWSNRPGDFTHNDFMLAYLALNNARSVFRNGVTTVRDV